MPSPNRTKIVATLGPASRTEASIEKLIAAGANVFRLNCAHTDRTQLVRDIRAIRRVSRRMGQPIGVLVDLQGPKIRVGPLHDAQPIWLKAGERLVLTTEPGFVGVPARDGEIARISTTYEGLTRDVKVGERVLLDDGYLELKVLGIDGGEVQAKVVNGGLLKQYKGINLPGSEISVECMDDKDIDDLKCALEHGADFIALSFVRSADDIRELRRRVDDLGSDAQLVAKIERPEAVRNLEEIMTQTDAVMVARGDMGVELGPEEVPALQKQIIGRAIAAKKPVITATQMLESMVSNPRPTRAEASDVANAIYDGTSAVMLSAETASGQYPIKAVQFMSRVARKTEASMFGDWMYRRGRRSDDLPGVSEATVKAAAYAATEVDAKLIAVFTESGATARLLAAERSPTRIVAFSPFQRSVQRLSLVWGVTAFKVGRARTAKEMTMEGERILLEDKIARPRDRIVVVVGSSRTRGVANIMNIREL